MSVKQITLYDNSCMQFSQSISELSPNNCHTTLSQFDIKMSAWSVTAENDQ